MGTSKLTPDAIDLDEEIDGHSFTIGWLLESLRTDDEEYKNLHGQRAVKKVTYQNVSAGKGFVSVIYRCIITFIDSIDDDSDTYSTILKIPGFESMEKAQNKCGSDKWYTEDAKKVATKIHQIECEFYEKISSILGAPVPKVYKMVEWIYGKQEGCIHMEDLTNRGRTITFFDNVNLEQIKCFIRNLAHMHKNSLTLVDSKLWKNKDDNFFNIFPFKKALASSHKMVKSLIEESNLKDKFQPLMEKYDKILQNFEFILFARKIAYKDLGIESVIVHGDMHSGNIMWAINDKDEIQNDIAAFVDWQVMQEGSPMVDLARFLIYCGDGKIRGEAENFAIEFYLECLEKEFGSEKDKIPYNLQQLKAAYNYAFISLSIFGMGAVPFFLGVISDHESNEKVMEQYREYGTLKALNILEDVDKIFSGEMKDVFESNKRNNNAF